MNGLYSEFESYIIPTHQNIDDALRSGVVAVDTNVLLSLYRYTDATVADLLKMLRRIDNRLFVPNQVIREFWRNRRSALSNPVAAQKDVAAALRKNSISSADAINRWAKSVALEGDLKTNILGRIDVFFDELISETTTGSTRRAHAATPTSEDSILTQLEQILEGRVGLPLEAEAWAEAIAEGNRRVLANEPPGYRDEEKIGNGTEEEAAGDYLVWSQLLDECARVERDLILVTSDTKEDWWEKSRDSNIGPRRELIEEFARYTSQRVYFLEPSDFLSRANVLDVAVSASSVEDVERVRDTIIPWDTESVLAVLTRLDQEGAIQAEVIREAAKNEGTISRQRVYEIDGRDNDQMLRGFTRPVNRVTAELQANDLIPEGLRPLLSSHYEQGVKTTHFVVPAEVIDILAAP